MRLLFLTSRLPFPPDRGDRVRTYNFLRHLSRDHEITLVSFTGSAEDSRNAHELQPYCAQIHLVHQPAWRSGITAALNAWQGLPLQLLYYRHPAMKKLVDSLLAQGGYAAAYVHLFRMAPYVWDHPQLYRLVDLTDVISSEISVSLPYRPALSRLLYQLEGPRIARYEQEVAAWADEVWLISDYERSQLAQVVPQANISVIPSGIDLSQIEPVDPSFAPPTLLFLGHMGVYHNVDAVEFLVHDILPLVRGEFPDCRLRIVGRAPSRRVITLGETPGVTVTGFVPDLMSEFAQSSVGVAPLRFSAGVQQKVLETMAAALPVVTTGRVNAGLGAEPGREILLAENAHDFAAQIINLLRDENRSREVGIAGRRFVEKRYTWESAVLRWQEIEREINGLPSD